MRAARAARKPRGGQKSESISIEEAKLLRSRFEALFDSLGIPRRLDAVCVGTSILIAGKNSRVIKARGQHSLTSTPKNSKNLRNIKLLRMHNDS